MLPEFQQNPFPPSSDLNNVWITSTSLHSDWHVCRICQYLVERQERCNCGSDITLQGLNQTLYWLVEFAIIDKYTQTLCTLYSARPICLLCARSPLGLCLETSCVSRSLFQSVFFFLISSQCFLFITTWWAWRGWKEDRVRKGSVCHIVCGGMRNVSLLVTAVLLPPVLSVCKVPQH